MVGCEYDGSGYWHHTVNLVAKGEKTFTPKRTARANEAAYSQLSQFSDLSVYIEAPLLGRAGVKTAVMLAYVAGAVQAGAIQAGAEVEIVNVQAWKSTVCGPRFGSAPKSEVAVAMSKLWPSLYAEIEDDQDLIDASAICWHAMIKRAK